MNVSGYNISESSIQISWNEIIETERNGIITNYTIKYKNIRTNNLGQIEVPPVLTAQVTGKIILLLTTFKGRNFVPILFGGLAMESNLT